MLPPRFMKKNPALGFASQKIGDFMNKIDTNNEFNKDFKDIKFDDLEKENVRGQEILSFRIEARIK